VLFAKLGASSLVVAVTLTVFALARTEHGRRHADALVIVIVVTLGALIRGLYLCGPETEYAGSRRRWCSTMFHLPPRRITIPDRCATNL
jgi:hypothetical protein